MKSEHNLFEELNTPQFYMEAAKAVFDLKARAFEKEVYFKSPLYEYVDKTQMYLQINGTHLAMYQATNIGDAIDRLTKGERIADTDVVKALIKEYLQGDMRVYWWVMWLFANECIIIKTESSIAMFAYLGDVGVMHTVFTGSTLETAPQEDVECVEESEPY